jgi:hypothetical protein
MAFFYDAAGEMGPVFGQNWPVPMRTDSALPDAPTDTASAIGRGKARPSPFTRSRVFAALQALGAPDDAPPPPRAPEWMSMPQPRFSGLLDPHVGQPQLMPAPAWMQPYLWGGR